MKYRFVPARHHGGPQDHVDRIVIHRTEGAHMYRGQALATARYFENGSGDRKASAHYCVDPGEVIQCVLDTVVAYHAPPNPGSIGVELCGKSADADFDTAEGGQMLGLAIALVADLCRTWKVPAIWLSPTDLKAGKRGITSHHHVSLAFHQTTHTDPGPHFPAESFVTAVARYLVRNPSEKVKPMYDPAIAVPPVVASIAHPETNGAVLLAADGSLRTFPTDAPGYRGVNGQPYWGDRKAASLRATGDWKHPIEITATTGEKYAPERA